MACSALWSEMLRNAQLRSCRFQNGENVLYLANSGKWKDGSKIDLENKDGNSSKVELKLDLELN